MTGLPQRPTVLTLAAIGPVVVGVVLAALRGEVSNAPAVLVLVLVVVAVAATGLRSAGLLAAASAGVSFDVLLTRPYGQLAIHSREDLEAMALLMVVGVAVTELSLWGRRQQSRASRASGFLDGLVVSAEAAQAADRPVDELARDVGERIVEVLALDRCRFVAGAGAGALPRLTRTGALAGLGSSHDVDRDGLPVDTEVAIEVRTGSDLLGSFLLTAASRVTRPSRDQRRTAVLLADQVATPLVSQRRALPAQGSSPGRQALQPPRARWD